MEPIPRIRILALSPGCPFDETACTPATAPARAFEMLDTWRLPISSAFITEAEPVKASFFGRTVCYHDHVVNRLRILLHHDVHTGFSGDSNTLGLIADEGHQQNTLPGNRNRLSAVSTRRRSDRRSVHHDCGTCYRSTGSVGNCTGNLLVLGHCNGANPQNSN